MSTVQWWTGPVEADDVESLWRDADTRGWLPADLGRVLVHVADAADPVVATTADSLVRFLRRRGTPRIEICGTGASVAGVDVLDLRTTPRYRVETACLRDGAAIPEAWLEELFVVTIASVAPDARLGLRGVLAAQAATLPNGGLDLDRAFVAHRLLRSNLAVACVRTRFGDAAAGTWWAISPDDLALDRAVAARAGLAPDTLPLVRHFARHELPTPPSEFTDGAPELVGYRLPGWRIGLGRCAARAAEGARRVTTDARLSVANLRRLPQFIERRVPTIARLRGAS